MAWNQQDPAETLRKGSEICPLVQDGVCRNTVADGGVSESVPTSHARRADGDADDLSTPMSTWHLPRRRVGIPTHGISEETEHDNG